MKDALKFALQIEMRCVEVRVCECVFVEARGLLKGEKVSKL